jgi:hypothetical protein
LEKLDFDWWTHKYMPPGATSDEEILTEVYDGRCRSFHWYTGAWMDHGVRIMAQVYKGFLFAEVTTESGQSVHYMVDFNITASSIPELDACPSSMKLIIVLLQTHRPQRG